MKKLKMVRCVSFLISLSFIIISSALAMYSGDETISGTKLSPSVKYVFTNGNNDFLTRADKEVGHGNIAQWVPNKFFMKFELNWPEETYLNIEECKGGYLLRNGNNEFLTRSDTLVGHGNIAQWVSNTHLKKFVFNWPEETYLNIEECKGGYLLRNGNNEFLTRSDTVAGHGNVAQWVSDIHFDKFVTHWPEETYLIIKKPSIIKSWY